MSIDYGTTSIGIIGLGDMGFPFAVNLIKTGYEVYGFDLRTEIIDKLVQVGGILADDVKSIVDKCDIVLTSLPSSDIFIRVAEHELIPFARKNQIFIELGTTIPYEIERLAELLKNKKAYLLDVPVSGGNIGAQKADLLMFGGGDKTIFEQVKPILEAIGGCNHVHYCGSSGNGQKMKGVNQLKMGVLNAAALEIISFCQNSGLDFNLIEKIFPYNSWKIVIDITRQIQMGKGNEVGVKFRELPYFLDQAEKQNFDLPITQTIYQYCDKGDLVVIDDHRQAPSFWNELTK